MPLEPRTEAEKTEFSAAARNHCVEQAFLRCLEDLERQTMNEDYTKYQAMKQTNEWKSSEAKKQEDFAKTKKELNDFLDSQVHEFEARQAQARIDRRNAEMKTIIPGSSGMYTFYKLVTNIKSMVRMFIRFYLCYFFLLRSKACVDVER